MSHNYRTRHTPNARPDVQNHFYHKHTATHEKAFRQYQKRLSEVTKPRKDSVEVLEYFVGASPEYFKNGGSGDYFNDALKWITERHGAENMISAGVHLDETTPHMWAYVVPEHAGKLNAKHFTGGRKKLSAMQTEFHEKVGEKYGLERGVEGSKASHTSIKDYYADMKKAGSLKPAETPSKSDYAIAATGLKPASVKAQEDAAETARAAKLSKQRAARDAKDQIERLKASQEASERLRVKNEELQRELQEKRLEIESERQEWTPERIRETFERVARKQQIKLEDENRILKSQAVSNGQEIAQFRAENQRLKLQLSEVSKALESEKNRNLELENELYQYRPSNGPGMR
jgi:hypothetical protein